MEEDKAVAYYEELTRKGEGASRFKQGLGFSSSNPSAPSRGSALDSHSSFLSTFVKSSSPTQTSKFEKQAQLEAIQNKLKKKPIDEPTSRVSERNNRESSHRHHSRSRERDRDRDTDRDGDRHRRRSRSRDKYRESERGRRRRRRRSKSRSVSPRRDRRSERRKHSRSLSPGRRRKENSRRDDAERDGAGKERNGGTDCSQLIQGYEEMTPAERVKVRMKLQLNEIAAKDLKKGMGSGWERFEFDKDAPLDDEEIEAVEDDVEVVKSTLARKEQQIKVAHDEAMFGAPALPGSMGPDIEPDADKDEKETNKTEVATSLLSEKVIAKQQGSWRDRARKG